MRYLFLLLVFGLSLLVNGQAPLFHLTTKVDYSGISFTEEEGRLAEAIAEYYKRTLPELKHPEANLELFAERHSILGHHYTYSQTFQGQKILGAELKVNLGKTHKTFSVSQRLHDTRNWDPLSYPDSEVASRFITSRFEAVTDQEVRQGVVLWEGEPKPVLILQVSSSSQNYGYQIVLDAQGTELYRQDLQRYFTMPGDSQVTARVFLPDPLSTARVVYEQPYIDGNDSDIVELNDERVTVSMIVNFENDTFFLESEDFLIKDLPGLPMVLAKSANPIFDYTRKEEGFEQVNAFYHLTNFKEHIKGLGFDTVVNYQLEIDPRATPADQSSFRSFTTPPSLIFGTGGVDDAEDADVIIHEFCHALSSSVAPSENPSSTERLAIEEGLCDYFAASYSYEYSDFHWREVFSWDGHNEFWTGRSTDTDKHYPEDLTNDFYYQSEIWSSAMSDLLALLGDRDLIDQLLVAAMYSFGDNYTMPQAARAMLQADSILYNNQHAASLNQVFISRGFFSQAVGLSEELAQKHGVKLLNSYAFALGQGEAIIELPSSQEYAFEVSDLSGCRIWSGEGRGNQIEISPDRFQPGVYIVHIKTGASAFSLKLKR